MTLDPIIVLCLATLTASAVGAWLILRPFERARREARRAQQHPAE